MNNVPYLKVPYSKLKAKAIEVLPKFMEVSEEDKAKWYRKSRFTEYTGVEVVQKSYEDEGNVEQPTHVCVEVWRTHDKVECWNIYFSVSPSLIGDSKFYFKKEDPFCFDTGSIERPDEKMPMRMMNWFKRILMTFIIETVRESEKQNA
jgi:hypothetical protein